MVDGAAAGTAACGLLPPGLQRAPCVGPADLAKQEGPLPAPLRGQRRNTAQSSGRSQASGSRDRLLEHPAHLGADLATASARSLCRTGRWSVPGPPTVDPVATALLSAGAGLEPHFSWQVRGWAEARLPPEEARVLWRMPSAGS